MRNELLDLIRAIVNTRFAVENVANTVIQDLRRGNPSTFRGHEWGKQHYKVMERVHQGVEAAWHCAKWLQFPEMESRLDDGFAASGAVHGRRHRDGQTSVDRSARQQGSACKWVEPRSSDLDSVEQLRALKLRPGKQPTKAEIKKVKEQFPAG